VGKQMPVDDIIRKILADKPFFDTSGGGVTVSGGEPTLFTDFLWQLLVSLKQNNIHTLLETCGYFDLNKFMDKIYPYLDMIYFDIKIINSDDHKKYCGVPNRKILDNLTSLSRAASDDGKILLPRTPLIPDITDTESNIQQIAAFLNKLNITEASLLAYNPLWHEKCYKVGVEDPFKNNKMMTSFRDNRVIERCRAIFADYGITDGDNYENR